VSQASFDRGVCPVTKTIDGYYIALSMPQHNAEHYVMQYVAPKPIHGVSIKSKIAIKAIILFC